LFLDLDHSKSDIQRIEACKRGDRVAQKELYDRYCDAMYTLAYRIVGNSESAKDVLQETFISVFRGIENFRFESTIGAWIKVILLRTAYKQVKNNIAMEYVDDTDLYTKASAEESDIYDFQHLEQAIIELPANARAVFTLVEIEGYKHKEIAEMLNISEGTSKSQLHYAKSILKKKLRKNGTD